MIVYLLYNRANTVRRKFEHWVFHFTNAGNIFQVEEVSFRRTFFGSLTFNIFMFVKPHTCTSLYVITKKDRLSPTYIF